jgi:hypothetical protein
MFRFKHMPYSGHNYNPKIEKSNIYNCMKEARERVAITHSTESL